MKLDHMRSRSRNKVSAISRPGWIWEALIFAIFTLSLAACSGQAPPVVSPTVAEAGEEQEVSPTEVATPSAEGATITYAAGAEPVSLDPANAIDFPSVEVLHAIYDGLVVLDENGKYQPALATDWTISDDQLIWTFSIREGVLFHDGSELDAEAVKFNIDRVMDESNELANAKQWTPFIDSVEVIDSHTVAITTKAPYGSLLDLLARFGLIVSPSAVEKYDRDLERNPVGTGPFMFDSWISGQRLVLIRNPNYWGDGPFVEEVVYTWYKEDSSRVLALEAGDVNVAGRIPAAAITVIEANQDLRINKATLYSTFYWAFNNVKDVWKDPKIRQALNYAIDRESIVDNVLLGVGSPAVGFISPSIDGAVPLDYTYDPEKARRLLEEANYPFDYEVTVLITEGRYYGDRQVGEAMQGMLEDIGMNINLEVLEWGAFVDAVWLSPMDTEVVERRDFAQTAFGTSDPATSLRQTLHCDSFPPEVYNEALYCNEQVSALLDQMNSTTNPDERREALMELQSVLAEDPPWIYSHNTADVFAHHKTVKNVILHPRGYILFHKATVEP